MLDETWDTSMTYTDGIVEKALNCSPPKCLYTYAEHKLVTPKGIK